MDPSSSNISACGSTSSVAVGMGILVQSRRTLSHATVNGLLPRQLSDAVIVPGPRGLESRGSALPALPHQSYEPLEQIAAVARAGRGLGVVLDREHRLVLERDAAVRAIEQRHMRLHRICWQRRAVDRKAVVHGGDLDLASSEVLYRMVRAMVALVHLGGGGADRDAEHLVTKADAERRHAA